MLSLRYKKRAPFRKKRKAIRVKTLGSEQERDVGRRRAARRFPFSRRGHARRSRARKKKSREHLLDFLRLADETVSDEDLASSDRNSRGWTHIAPLFPFSSFSLRPNHNISLFNSDALISRILLPGNRKSDFRYRSSNTDGHLSGSNNRLAHLAFPTHGAGSENASHVIPPLTNDSLTKRDSRRVKRRSSNASGRSAGIPRIAMDS